jgi:hypothetical protein
MIIILNFVLQEKVRFNHKEIHRVFSGSEDPKDSPWERKWKARRAKNL